jgi:L-rhamnose mutarotase
MARLAFILRIREGMVSEYRRLHEPENLWPSIISACVEAGMRNYSGFIGGPDGRTVFAVFEADDPMDALAKLGATDANADWQKHMAPMLETDLRSAISKVEFLEEVFHID